MSPPLTANWLNSPIILFPFTVSSVLLVSTLLSIWTFSSSFLIMDSVSYAFIFLTTMVFLMSLFSVGSLLHMNYSYKMLIVLLYLIVILFFMANTLLTFFILFEASLMPITLLILGWGYQSERIMASYYLLMYTLVFSMPLMVNLLLIVNSNHSPALMNDYLNISALMEWMLLAPFLTKFPIYFLHLWLPKAHVEASMTGSILLAAILLKMGLYGVFRINLMFFNYHLSTLTLGSMGVICSATICLFQSDLKSLIAYSSVFHMTSMFLILEMGLSFSIKAMVMMGVVHGFVSASLFLYSGVLYASSNTRLMFFLQGVLLSSPTFSLFLAMGTLTNFGIPPFMSVYSELLTMMTIVNWSKAMILMALTLTFLSCYYNLYLWNMISHGKYTQMKDNPMCVHFNLISFSFFWFMTFFIIYSGLVLTT